MTRQHGGTDQPNFEDVSYGNAVEARSVDFRTQQRGHKHHYADALEKKVFMYITDELNSRCTLKYKKTIVVI